MKKFARTAFFLFIVFALALLFMFPLYILFKISVSQPQDVFADKPSYGIPHCTLMHFKNIWSSGGTFFFPLAKSAATAFLAAVLSVFISAPAAYAITRFSPAARYVFLLCIFVSRMIPEVSIALPVSVTFIRLGMFDTTIGLVLAHLVRILPVSCFILSGVFSGIPADLEKQACVDGANRLGAFIRVVLPLSLGGISVAGIFAFLLSWDEFIYASYLSLSAPTMPLKMYYYISRGDIFSSSAYAVIITLPVLVITFALQKYLKPDYLSGAVKG